MQITIRIDAIGDSQYAQAAVAGGQTHKWSVSADIDNHGCYGGPSFEGTATSEKEAREDVVEAVARLMRRLSLAADPQTEARVTLHQKDAENARKVMYDQMTKATEAEKRAKAAEEEVSSLRAALLAATTAGTNACPLRTTDAEPEKAAPADPEAVGDVTPDKGSPEQPVAKVDGDEAF